MSAFEVTTETESIQDCNSYKTIDHASLRFACNPPPYVRVLAESTFAPSVAKTPIYCENLSEGPRLGLLSSAVRSRSGYGRRRVRSAVGPLWFQVLRPTSPLTRATLVVRISSFVTLQCRLFPVLSLLGTFVLFRPETHATNCTGDVHLIVVRRLLLI